MNFAINGITSSPFLPIGKTGAPRNDSRLYMINSTLPFGGQVGQSDKILILGARGNLGGQLMRVLGNDYRLVCWDREDLDITNRNEVSKKINEVRPNIIINTAAYNAVDKCEEDDEEYQKAKALNGDAVGFIADAALSVGALFVHYSTDYVFAGDKKLGYVEEDQAIPINKYGETKLLGERELELRARSGLRYYLIRTSKLFGPKGESDMAKPNFFDVMREKAETDLRLSIVNEEVSSFTYTFDLARATKELIEGKNKYGIYHITNEGVYTWFDAARLLFKLLKKEIVLNSVSGSAFPRPAKRPAFSILLNTKLKPQRKLEDALAEYLKIEN